MRDILNTATSSEALPIKRPRLAKRLASCTAVVILNLSGSERGSSVVATEQWPKLRYETCSSAMPDKKADYDTRIESDLLASQLVHDAIKRYRSPRGFEGHLIEAAWQIEQLGKEAWPTLDELAASGVPECEFFLGPIIRIPDVPQEARLATIRKIAINPNVDVRNRLLELMTEVPASQRPQIIADLASPLQPDDSASQWAASLFKS